MDFSLVLWIYQSALGREIYTSQIPVINTIVGNIRNVSRCLIRSKDRFPGITAVRVSPTGSFTCCENK